MKTKLEPGDIIILDEKPYSVRAIGVTLNDVPQPAKVELEGLGMPRNWATFTVPGSMIDALMEGYRPPQIIRADNVRTIRGIPESYAAPEFPG